jgi:hypothetical protein
MEYESMTAIQFIEQYTTILEEIDSLMHPDCYPAMRVMFCVDPHDLITPNAYFANREQAFGFVWKLLAAKVKELKNAN